MRYTCAICLQDTFGGRWGLCTEHLKQWSVTGTYREVTLTGTFYLPEWIRIFSAEHNRDEQRKYWQEIPFSHAFPEGEYDGVYIEPRYPILEEKYRKIERRGQPRKLHGKKSPPQVIAEG